MKRCANILVICLISCCAFCQEQQPDNKPKKVSLPIDSIYQGTTLKFDLGSAAYMPIRYKGQVQTYDFAINAQIFHKFFPTLEAGYAQARLSGDDDPTLNRFSGYGGFMRLGMDYSVLKKYKGDNHLLIGVRIGTSLQGFSYSNMERSGSYWPTDRVDLPTRFTADAWGEIVAGVQVHIYKSLNMGWFLRYKILMTRGKTLDGVVRPAYIMGYGTRNESTFGWNYYIGWKF